MPAGCGVTSLAADNRAPNNPTERIRSASNGRATENSRPALSSKPEPANCCSSLSNWVSEVASTGPATLAPSARRSIAGAVPLKKMSSTSSRANKASNGPNPPNAACTAATSSSSSAWVNAANPTSARCATHDSSSSNTTARACSRRSAAGRSVNPAPSAEQPGRGPLLQRGHRVRIRLGRRRR